MFPSMHHIDIHSFWVVQKACKYIRAPSRVCPPTRFPHAHRVFPTENAGKNVSDAKVRRCWNASEWREWVRKERNGSAFNEGAGCVSAHLLALTPGTLRWRGWKTKGKWHSGTQKRKWGKSLLYCSVSGNDVMYPGMRPWRVRVARQVTPRMYTINDWQKSAKSK